MGQDWREKQIWGMSAGVAVVVIIAALIFVTQCYIIIPPGHRGVSVTLGTVDSEYRTEGMNFKMPFVEDVHVFNVQQVTQTGQAACFSSDLQTVMVEFKAMYRIPEAKVVRLFQEYQGDPYASLLEPRIQETLKEVSADYRAEELVKNREEVKIKTLERLKSKLMDLKKGKTTEQLLYLVDLTINNVDLSADLEHAIEQKQIKEQEALAKKYELDKARKEAEITMVNAEAEAQAVRIKGDALRSSPHVIDLEIAKKWDGKAPSTVVTGKGGSNVLLPLR